MRQYMFARPMRPGGALGLAVVLAAQAAWGAASEAAQAPAPVVEVEETLYDFKPADNGAGPLWCHGSTCLVRHGGRVWASGLETVPEAKPLNNCRWTLFVRSETAWRLTHKDAHDRTREPCPLAVFSDGRVFLSVNPTLAPGAYSGPARPEILEFAAGGSGGAFQRLRPQWEGQPAFTEHSYRSFAADGPARELILFQNIGYTHAEWAFLQSNGTWSARGQLRWPFGADYDKPQPIRVCYPTVALVNRAVHFCGVSDILEPNPTWRAYKKQLTGRDWDYDFRRLFYTWSPNVAGEGFRPWVEVASREKTGGWIMPLDLWVAPDGSVHLLWSERALDERLREKFFPDTKQSHALNHAVLKAGAVVRRQAVAEAREGGSRLLPSFGRFHVTPDNRLWVLFYVSGTDQAGTAVSENRWVELLPEGRLGPVTRVPLKQPMSQFFTAAVRAGSAPSRVVDLLGQRPGQPHTIAYTRLRIP